MANLDLTDTCLRCCRKLLQNVQESQKILEEIRMSKVADSPTLDIQSLYMYKINLFRLLQVLAAEL